MSKYFNIPLRYKLYYEEKKKEENLGKEIAERIINKLQQKKVSK